MKRIKVAYVINSILMAGAETVVLEMASHLDKAQFDPCVFALNDYGAERPSLLSRFEERGIPVVFLSSGRKISIGSAAISLIKRVREFKPDVVHAHLPNSVISAGIVSIILRVPFIIHEHQVHTFHSWKIRLAYSLLRPFAQITVCYTIGVEKDLFGKAHKLESPPKRLDYRSFTINNGVNVERVEHIRATIDRHAKRTSLGIENDDVLIVSTARFVEWKGHRNLIEAFEKAASQNPKLKLLIAGDGPLHAELLSQVHARGLSERVRMPGVRTDVYEILAIADMFSLVFDYPGTVDAEAIGIAGFEAMASGVPVIIGAYTDATLYIQDGENGVLVEPRNSDALAAAILRLAAAPVERKRIGELARAYVARELSWSAIIRIYEAIYRLICAS